MAPFAVELVFDGVPMGALLVVLAGVGPAVLVFVLPAGALAVVRAGEEGATVEEADVPRSSPATLPTRFPNAPKLENGDADVGGGDRAAVADAVSVG